MDNRIGLAVLLAAAVPALADTGVGTELQVYPAGVIATLKVSTQTQPNQRLNLYVGYNETDRQDFGEHDDEQGGGAGAGVGYQFYFSPNNTGWYLGARLDLWQLDIDWTDQRNGSTVTGNSDVTVLQPTLRGGYSWQLNPSSQNGNWVFEAGLALGAEINISTTNEDVGEGAIVLGGAAIEYQF